MIRISASLILLGAGTVSLAERSWIETLMKANQLARRGSVEAVPLYDLAAQHTSDPGLIAFNQAAYCLEQGNVREAELLYLRCLEDREIPERRRVEALYNRAVCLILRGDRAAVYRAAITSIEECLDSPTITESIANDARHNLELAKLLWNQARVSEANRPTPNESAQDDSFSPSSPAVEPDMSTETTPGQSSTPTEGESNSTRQQPGDARSVNQPRPGTGTIPVLQDTDDVQKLTPEDTKTLLDRTAQRLKAARRQNESLRAGPERPNVRDW